MSNFIRHNQVPGTLSQVATGQLPNLGSNTELLHQRLLGWLVRGDGEHVILLLTVGRGGLQGERSGVD